MSEHKIKAGDKVFLPLEATEVNHRGVVYCTYNANEAGLGWWPASALVPADNLRTLTPIAPEDVREGDVVRLEWEDDDGRPRAHEGPVEAHRSHLLTVDGYYVDRSGRTVYLLHRAPTERDEWWPPQPGDVAKFLGYRWAYDRAQEWHCLDGTIGVRRTDVPDDAVLVLPAQTREATS